MQAKTATMGRIPVPRIQRTIISRNHAIDPKILEQVTPKPRVLERKYQERRTPPVPIPFFKERPPKTPVPGETKP